ncbi:MAG: nucleoside deaminase [Xanthomonadales bacterium]|nr:nucleoside deaminase [Xanthomonadales bacterium]
MPINEQCSIRLPAWVQPWLDARKDRFDSEDGRMGFVIDLARENVRMETGGPFGAAVFDLAEQALISVGVNLVTASGLSMAHAEMVALSLAQESLGDWDLARHGELSLVTSCEPCAMCFGAVPWSGVRSMVCGARKEDAERAGFDEGDKPTNWADSLRQRGIEVTENVLPDRAANVFHFYRQQGGVIYNPGNDK